MRLEKAIPDWITKLGTPEGVADHELVTGISLPLAMREFYACPPLVACVEASLMGNGEVFLRDYAECIGEEIVHPPLVHWNTVDFLIFAFYNHSGMVCAAVSIVKEDPPVAFGFEGEEPPSDGWWKMVPFSRFVFAAVYDLSTY